MAKKGTLAAELLITAVGVSNLISSGKQLSTRNKTMKLRARNNVLIDMLRSDEDAAEIDRQCAAEIAARGGNLSDLAIEEIRNVVITDYINSKNENKKEE